MIKKLLVKLELTVENPERWLIDQESLDEVYGGDWAEYVQDTIDDGEFFGVFDQEDLRAVGWEIVES